MYTRYQLPAGIALGIILSVSLLATFLVTHAISTVDFSYTTQTASSLGV